jgi:hypothetical protein
MSDAETRLQALLAACDAPAEDEVFVGRVMSQAVHPAPRTVRQPWLPIWLRPLATIAPILALGLLAPFIMEAVRGHLTAEDVRVVFGCLALSLAGWVLLDAFSRSRRPVFST